MNKKLIFFIFIFTFILFLQIDLAQASFCAKDPYTDQWKCWGSGYKCYDYWSPVPCGGNQINFSGTVKYAGGGGVLSFVKLTATIKYRDQEFSAQTITREDGSFFVKIEVPSYLNDKDFYVTFYVRNDIEAFYTCWYDHTTEQCS
jgi:hypothetical protein